MNDQEKQQLEKDIEEFYGGPGGLRRLLKMYSSPSEPVVTRLSRTLADEVDNAMIQGRISNVDFSSLEKRFITVDFREKEICISCQKKVAVNQGRCRDCQWAVDLDKRK